MQIQSKIRDTQAQDRIINTRSKCSQWLTTFLLVAFFLAGVMVILPRLIDMFSGEAKASRRQFQFATVERGQLTKNIAAHGRVVAAISPTVFASAMGTINLQVKAGQQVGINDVLAIIESPELASEYAQQLALLKEQKIELERQKILIKNDRLDSQQKIEQAQVDLELSKKNKQRAEANIEVKVISQEDFEIRAAELKKIELQHQHAIAAAKLANEKFEFEIEAKKFKLQQHQLKVDDLRRQVEALTLRSPINGTVAATQIKERDSVTKNQALMTLVDLNVFEVDLNIPESYADELGIGLKTEVQLGSERFNGELIAIAPEVSNGQVAGRVRFTDDQPQGLRQNQRVTARIILDTKQDVLKVKRGSFVESGGGQFAYVLNDNLAEKTVISLGEYSVDEIEVVSGLSPGDTIIISNIEQYLNNESIYLIN